MSQWSTVYFVGVLLGNSSSSSTKTEPNFYSKRLAVGLPFRSGLPALVTRWTCSERLCGPKVLGSVEELPLGPLYLERAEHGDREQPLRSGADS